MPDIAFIELTSVPKKSRVSIAISDINMICEVDGKFKTNTIITLKHKSEPIEVEETYDDIKNFINETYAKNLIN